MGLFSGVKKVFKSAAPILGAVGGSFIPGLGTALGASLGGALGGAIQGNGLKGIAGGALAGYGIGGGAASLGSYLSGAGNLGLGSAASGALGGSLIGAGSGALSGGTNGALLGSVLGGGAGYIQGSGGLGNAYNNIKSDLGLQGAGVDTVASAAKSPVSVGGGNSAYSTTTSNPSSYAFASQDGVNGNLTTSLNNAAQSAGGSSVKSNLISPFLSAGLSGFANNRAEGQLMKQQKRAEGILSPFLNASFNPGDLTQDPGYQFQLDQGTKAIDRAAASRGGYFSGQALQEAQDYGQGLAGQTYKDAYNRWLQTQGQKLGAAGALSGVYDNIGNIGANSTINTSNSIAGALGSALGGPAVNSSGALLNSGNNDNLTRILLGLRGY